MRKLSDITKRTYNEYLINNKILECRIIRVVLYISITQFYKIMVIKYGMALRNAILLFNNYCFT